MEEQITYIDDENNNDGILFRLSGPNNDAKLLYKNGSYILLKGSRLREETNSYFSDPTYAEYKELCASKIDQERRLIEDRIYNNPSRPAAIANGSSANGKTLWIDENNITLGERLGTAYNRELLEIAKLKKFYYQKKGQHFYDKAVEDYDNLLRKYLNEYPVSRFKYMDVLEYALATVNWNNSFSYKIEFGEYKHLGFGIGGGNAYKHGFCGEGNRYKKREGYIENIETYWDEFRGQLYNCIINLATPHRGTSSEFPLLLGMSQVLCKLAFLYYPDRYISIGAKSKLIEALKVFGYKYDKDDDSEHLNHILSENILNSIPELREESPIVKGMLVWDYLLEQSNIINEEETIIEDVVMDGNVYNRELFLKDVFMTPDKYDDIYKIMERKLNIILQGPPGVGKTYCAKKLLLSLMGEKGEEAEKRIRTVQFHQSYSYEDFVEGIRPDSNGVFTIQTGIFYDLVIDAIKEDELSIKENRVPKKYGLVIDEINRGNLSKIFGELMMLIEKDKRNAKWSINLTYGKNKKFYIPSNLYIVGTMNTADKSLSIVDYALRRRFGFINLEPAFDNETFKNKLVNEKNISKDFVDKLSSDIIKLNSEIKETLGEGFEIGHSYFTDGLEIEDLEASYNSIIDYEIKPLLIEYYENINKVNNLIDIIKH